MRCNSSSLPYRRYFQSVVSYHLSLNTRGYRALIYSGDHDMVVPYLGTLAWIRSLNFTVVHLWRPWLVDGEIAGYSRKHSNNFTFATVKGGGHTAPEYKPKECFAMFKREEKRRKFNEAVLNTLFPPPSPPSSPPPKDEEVPLSILHQDFEEDLGESGSATTSGDDDGNGESDPQRLTRAQRKRLRKKKLKEDASRRRELIGPLLPPTVDQGENEAQGVRRNASEEPDAALVEKPGDEPAACSNQNKVKQRRKAKKLAREREQD